MLPTDITNGDYTFLGWYEDSSFSGSAVTEIGTAEYGNKTYYARWGNVFVVSDATCSYTYTNHLLTITSGGSCTISMNTDAGITSTTTDRIKVTSSEDVTITINSLNVTSSSASPFEINASGGVTVKLSGTNVLKSTVTDYAGLQQTSTTSTLTITSASGDGSTNGSLTATGGSYGAGIGGGGSNTTGGAITINGGTVTATGGIYAAGIGGVNGGRNGTITINGGKITATGGDRSAGIGAGNNAAGGTITISGGTVTATGGSDNGGYWGGAGIGGGSRKAGGTITISGSANVTAVGGDYAAGIGGGGIGEGSSGGGGTITISGSATVTATGGTYGAGIGGGNLGDGGTITISGSANVTAVGGNFAAGIGGGNGGSGGTIEINGGTVTATNGTQGAGIGGGASGTGGTINISGGTITATSGSTGAGIGGGKYGDGGSVTITGGYVTATSPAGGAGIGGGGNAGDSNDGGDGGTVSISGGYILLAVNSKGNPIGAGQGGSSNGTITITGGYYGTGDIDADTVYSASVYTGYGVADNTEDTKETYPYVVIKYGTEYTVTFVLSIGKLNNSNPITYAFGTGTEIPAETDISEITGYNFGGWYESSDYSGNAVTSIGKKDYGNKTLYAKLSCTHTEYSTDGFCTTCGYYEPANWNGSSYEIGNPGQLLWFAALVNGDTSSGLVEFTDDDTARGTSANAVLTADIDMGSYGSLYVPIGRGNAIYKNSPSAVAAVSYKGTFDGQGYVISNLTVSAVTTNDIGIFGSLSGTVKNLGVCNFSNKAVTADARGGAIAGQICSGGNVENCYVQNSVISCSGKVAGGLAGANYSGTVKNCYVVGTSVTASRMGSIVGDNEDNGNYVGTVTNCYTDGSYLVTSDSSHSGTVSGCEASVSSARFASGEIAWLLQHGQDDESSLVWGQGLTGSTDSYPILTSTSSLRVMKVIFYLVTDGTAATEASATVYTNNGSVLASDSYPATGETGYEYLFYTDSSCEDGYQIIASSHTYNYDSGEATETVYMKKVSAAAYTVTIPATAALGGTATINATGVTVSSGKSLVVKLTGTSETDNTFKVRNLLDSGDSGTGVLSYALTKGEAGSEEAVAVGDTILTVAGGTTEASGSVQLNFGTPTDTPKFAGEYTGTVTFTVSVETDSG